MLHRFMCCAAAAAMVFVCAHTTIAQTAPAAETSASGDSTAPPRFPDTLESFSANSADGSASDAAVVTVDEDPFDQGSFSLSFYGSGAWGSRGDLYMGHVALGYYFVDRIAFEVEGYGGAVITDQSSPAGHDHGLGGIAIRLRHHWIVEDDWSLYFDIGAGTQWHREPFPVNGTHQNFSPQVGLGITYELDNNWRLMLGGRWLHISNASRKGEQNNPGYDGGMAYIGLMTSF